MLWEKIREALSIVDYLSDSVSHFWVAFSLALLVLTLTLIMFFVYFWDKESGRLVVDNMVVAFYIIGFGVFLSCFLFLASHAILDSLEVFYKMPLNEPLQLRPPKGT